MGSGRKGLLDEVVQVEVDHVEVLGGEGVLLDGLPEVQVRLVRLALDDRDLPLVEGVHEQLHESVLE